MNKTTKKPSTKLRPRFKLWLSYGEHEGAFGDGKWRLLRAIEQEGSLRAASETMHMSYRKAWGDVKKAEQALGVTLVKKQRGGCHGGSATLTKAGKEWVRAYTRMRTDVEHTVKTACRKYVEKISP